MASLLRCSHWRGVKLRAGGSKKLTEFNQFGPVQATGFEILEVGKLLDFPLHALPAHGLKNAKKPGDVLVPCPDLAHKIRHGTLGPKPALVVHLDIEAYGLGLIQ